MQTAYYEDYQSSDWNGNNDDIAEKDEDAQAATFLLSMKHRSVTPEPLFDDFQPERQPRQEVAKPAFAACSYTPQPYACESSTAAYNEDSRGCGSQNDDAVSSSSSSTPDICWEDLLADSKLVFLKDRDLVPDALFVAMAQMKPCRLTHADRVGCYKTREIGFVGMCCKHCGGQPGFGRYYPNSVRSLAQTTTSQTILKHISGKCRFCPPNVRDAVVELQRQQAGREGMPSSRPRYGSRKIFFQRVWSRLHGGKACKDLEDEDSKSVDEVSNQHSDCDETSMTSETTSESLVAATSCKRKGRYASPPPRKNKRAKHSDSFVHRPFTAE